MKKRIMLVDDDRVFGSALVFGLEVEGYEVHYLLSANNIIEEIDRVKPNLLVLDVEIDNINGIEIAPVIKLINKELPIIFVSSHGDVEHVTDAINGGGAHYLRKPFEIEELLVYIDRYIGNPNIFMEFGNCKLEIDTHRLYVNNCKVPEQLSYTECKLLSLLILDINKAVTHERVQAAMYGDASSSNDRSINNTITRIRKYISSDSSLEIKNIRNIGYMMICGD
ncbi:MAG: response regulator transcription factor [Rikenellaceae bacterium]